MQTNSNAIVENWFKLVKHSSQTGADSIATIYKNIEAFKFGFTPLGKVFTPKKKIHVENECEEEWSRSKKCKFSYNKRTIGNVVKY